MTGVGTAIENGRSGMTVTKWRRVRLFEACLLVLASVAVLMTPRVAFAQDSGRIVRVGWYESPFNITDEVGRRSGYAYEYQQKIAAYTGWTYEYVEGSWPDLMQMLEDGKIDLLSDVSYTEERAEDIFFSALPMGSEDYFLFVSSDNDEITTDDLHTLDGKKVGANRGSIQVDLFCEWAEANGVQAEIVEMTGSEDENMIKLAREDVDMYVTLGALGENRRVEPICKIGSSDFFFAVSKSRPELLPELNAAMYRIQDENQFYNQQLCSEYLDNSSVSLFLNAEEKAWLEEHKVIRVGYQDNYLAFCATDPETGELTGALKDYLDAASDCLENAHLDFEPVAYPTASAALAALKSGEVDCMFPCNLTDYDGEVEGFFVTSPLMRTDMSAVIRAEDQKTFAKKERVAVAVNAGNTNYDLFLLDHFPDWRSIYFKDTPACLEAIADGKADCLLISNYRHNNISALCEQYQLVTLSTGVEMDYCFAVNRGDTVLYSLLNKVTGEVPASTVNAALTYYYTEDAKTSLGDTLRKNLAVAVGVFVAVALLIVLIVLLYTRRKKRPARPND